MAQSLQARVAGRGFPVYDASGQSGQGHLPDSTRPGASVPGQASGQWRDPNTDPASVGATLAAPQEFISGGLWGLSGGLMPDHTPRTHAAPFADPTLPVGEYFEEADAAHGADFGAYETRLDIPTKYYRPLDLVTAEDGTGSNLQPLSGPIRALGGKDGVQGYGALGKGPRGTNATMPLAVEQRNYPGSFYSADSYVNAAEVPLLVPDAFQFIPNAPELGPWQGGFYQAPMTSVQAQDVVAGDSPAQGHAVSEGPPAYVTSFWR